MGRIMGNNGHSPKTWQGIKSGGRRPGAGGRNPDLASISSRPGTAPEPRNKGPGMGQPRDSPGTSRNKLFFPKTRPKRPRRAPTNTLNQPMPPGARAGILSAPPAPCFRQVPRNTPGRPSKYQARPGELPNGPPGGASPLRGPGYGVFRTGKGLPPRGGKKSEGNRQNRHVHPRQ